MMARKMKIHDQNDLRKTCYKANNMTLTYIVVFVQSLSCVWFFAIPWTAACQASLSLPISWSLLKLMSAELVMPSNQLIFCRPQPLPSIFLSIRVFSMSWLFASGGQSIGASTSTSVLPMNIQGWFLEDGPRDSQESSPRPQLESINSLTQLSL